MAVSREQIVGFGGHSTCGSNCDHVALNGTLIFANAHLPNAYMVTPWTPSKK